MKTVRSKPPSMADIANGVSFLSQEAAGWITGETMSINGGQFMY